MNEENKEQPAASTDTKPAASTSMKRNLFKFLFVWLGIVFVILYIPLCFAIWMYCSSHIPYTSIDIGAIFDHIAMLITNLLYPNFTSNNTMAEKAYSYIYHGLYVIYATSIFIVILLHELFFIGCALLADKILGNKKLC